MRCTHHSLPALALAALLGTGATLAPSAAPAQGRSHNDKADKHLEKQVRRDASARRYDVRYDDGRWDDRDDTRTAAVRGNRGSSAGVPPGQMPPAGMCRIWIDGVPPGRQPRATDCATARRNAPRNSRIIYGPRTSDRYDDRYDARNDGRYGVYDRGSIYDRDGDGDYDARDEAIRRREEVLRGRRDGGTNTCVDANRDGRCDW